MVGRIRIEPLPSIVPVVPLLPIEPMPAGVYPEGNVPSTYSEPAVIFVLIFTSKYKAHTLPTVYARHAFTVQFWTDDNVKL